MTEVGTCAGSVRHNDFASLAADVVVLGIDGFGCGQPHSDSWPCNETHGALVEHLFFGSWKPASPVQPDENDDDDNHSGASM